MGDLHLPRSQHLLDIGDDIVQGQRPREVIARGEIAANLLRRHRRHNGAARDVGREPCLNAPDFLKRQVCVPSRRSGKTPHGSLDAREDVPGKALCQVAVRRERARV